MRVILCLIGVIALTGCAVTHDHCSDIWKYRRPYYNEQKCKKRTKVGLWYREANDRMGLVSKKKHEKLYD